MPLLAHLVSPPATTAPAQIPGPGPKSATSRRPGGGRGRLGADLLPGRQPEAPTPGIAFIPVPRGRPPGGHRRRCRGTTAALAHLRRHSTRVPGEEGGSASDEGTILEKDDGLPTSGGVGRRRMKEEARTRKLLGKRRRFGSPERTTSEESSTARSYRRPAHFSVNKWDYCIYFEHLASIDEKMFEEMRRHNQSLLEIEQEKLRFQREKQDYERKKAEKEEDERILGVDLNACPPPLRLYYQTLQEEILEKIRVRRRSSLAP